MKTLYVTDLDGTLLGPEQKVSAYTERVINEFVGRGMLFTYATARSGETAAQVTEGLLTSAPRVLYNGAFAVGADGSIIVKNTFEDTAAPVIDSLLESGVYPIVYSLIDGREKFSYLPDKLTKDGAEFIATRKTSVRRNPVLSAGDLYKGDAFYLTCIDAPTKLAPLYEKFKNDFSCVYQRDIYSGAQWLEIMPKAATKANALAEIKRMLGCRLVVFGDGKNDAEMFRAADESYAVENACEELKFMATAVIGKNSDDGVAKQLIKLYSQAASER